MVGAMRTVFSCCITLFLGAAACFSAVQHGAVIGSAGAQDAPAAFAGRDPVESPTLGGLPPIESNFGRASEVVIKRTRPKVDAGPIGAFRFVCQPAQINWDDPIMYPGQIGASPHLHQWFGNTLGNANSTFASLRKAGDSTCMGPLNRSGYWMPAMIRGGNAVVTPDYLTVYYKRYPKDAPECQLVARGCLPLPQGLRYIFGFDMLRIGKSQGEVERHLHWRCVGPDNRLRGAMASDFSELQCVPGDLLIATLAAPDCWNGTALDSADHRAHLAYPYYDGTRALPRCPSSHPYLIPQFTLGATWRLQPGDNLKDWYLASDRMPGMPQLPAGRSLHSDWFGAWDPETMATWTRNCIDRKLSCVDGELGDGTGMKRPPGYSLTVRDRIRPIPPHPATAQNPHAEHQGHPMR